VNLNPLVSLFTARVDRHCRIWVRLGRRAKQRRDRGAGFVGSLGRRGALELAITPSEFAAVAVPKVGSHVIQADIL
jgi:hypothetical protein